MIYRYTYEKESYHHIDIGSYTSYAVKVYKDSKCVEYLPDLFDEAKKALRFTRLCEALYMEPKYIYDFLDIIHKISSVYKNSRSVICCPAVEVCKLFLKFK